MEEGGIKKPKAVVVGGSIAGISCAHSLMFAGWDVVVIEKTSSPPTRSSTGAGLGLDPLSQHLINSWLPHPNLLDAGLGLDPLSQHLINSWLPHPNLLETATLPLTIDQNQVTDAEKKSSCTLTRDESFNFRAAYWADLHNILYQALPQDTVLWGHLFLSFSISDDKSHVNVKTQVITTGEVIEIGGDLLVAADGCLSAIRQIFLPELKLRYSGYCAWRGVLDFSENEKSEAVVSLKKVYPDLGRCLYFDLSSGTHSVFYELLNKRINWVWYVNQPEPELKGNSVTMKVSSEMIEKMQEEAEEVWVPELVRVIKETPTPFLNVIYDSDPLERIFWDNVVLVGDAAHPTTPHGLRSTNMSILDAAVLGKCLEKWGVQSLTSALQEYQSIRLPVVSKQVLHARRLGRIKQGLILLDREPFNPANASPEDYEELQQKNMPFFADTLI